MRTDEEILSELEELGEQDSNDYEIDRLRDIVHELLDDRSLSDEQIYAGYVAVRDMLVMRVGSSADHAAAFREAVGLPPKEKGANPSD